MPRLSATFLKQKGELPVITEAIQAPVMLMDQTISLMFWTQIRYLLEGMLLLLNQVLGWTQMVKEPTVGTCCRMRMLMDLRYFSHVYAEISLIDDQSRI